ncbi:hypothetical protein [Vitreimonas sp.]|uniref:hypothetical protein n=1 Tax=Vitreimonas sp. TaxID=3069702 RepID=UPI002D797D00|nr:hypothetical protein [Vitreimonas sp.]
MLFTAPLMRRRGDGMVTAPRTLTLQLNDTVQQWRFVPSGNADQDQRVRCRPIAPRGLGSDLVVDEVALTALISLIPTSDADSPTYSTDATFTFTNVDGWTWIDDLSLDEIERSGGGEFRAISAEQNVSSLEVDGRSVSMGSYDNLWVFGDLLGAHGDNAQIAVNGTAWAAWKNGERLIPTRWERAPNWQIPLLTTFFGTIAALLALARLQSSWLQKVGGEDPKSWLRH